MRTRVFDSARGITSSRWWLGLLLLPALLLPQAAAAVPAQPVVIDEPHHYPLSMSSVILTEPGLDWRSAANYPLHSLSANRSPTLNLEDEGLPAWIRVDLRVTNESVQDWLLDIGNSFAGEVTLFLVQNGELLSRQQINGYESFYARPVRHRESIFELTLSANQTYQVLLKVDRTADFIYLTRLHPAREFYEADRKETWRLGILLGVLIALAIYHLMITAATRDISYFYYALYIGASALFNLARSGFGFEYVWPHWPSFQFYGSAVIAVLPVITAIVFSVNFLKLPKIAPKIAKVYYGAMVGIVVMLGWVMTGGDDAIRLMFVTTWIVYGSFIPTAIYAARQGVVYARYYILAWIFLCVAIINWLLGAMGFSVPFFNSSYRLVQYGLVIQLMFLALALSHRIKTLRDEKLVAEADNRAKSDFLAKMSHEIRTPLSGVLGMSELLAERLKDETDKQYNNIIRSSGQSLLRIINDILDFSKFSSGKMQLEKTAFNLRDEVEHCVDLFRPQAADKNLEISMNINHKIPDYVIGDPTRIRQVIQNLLSNAIKFTDRGYIQVGVIYQDIDNNLIRISVTDTGGGISENDKNKLFEVFTQADSSVSRTHGGTGLGLAICKQLAGLMGGSIGCDSDLGRGTTFWITAQLPAGKLEDVDNNQPLVNVEGARILVIDQDTTFAHLLQMQSASLGIECVLVNRGDAGIAEMKKHEKYGKSFDLIVLNQDPPLMDGVGISRKIQENAEFNKIPRLLLGSDEEMPSMDVLSEAGIWRAMEKPALPDDVITVCRRMLSQIGYSKNDSVNEAVVWESKGNEILVAEDNSVNQMVINGLLKRLGYKVTIVPDGEQAVEKAASDDRNLAAVLMDCEMPNLNGMDATRAIRRWEKENGKKALPIVALTAHAVKGQIDLCLDAGMSAYLTKPIEVDKLKETLALYTAVD